MSVVGTIREVHVERGLDGVLVVRWAADGRVAVDVGAGTSPLASEHSRFGRATTATSVRLDGLDRERRYVSLTPQGGAPLVVAERRLPVVGAATICDLGGYATVGDAATRWGRVFRASALHELTVTDLVVFHRLGVRTVYDLRDETERNSVPLPMESVHAPLPEHLVGASSRPAPAEVDVDEARTLGLRYVDALRHGAAVFGWVLRGLTDRDGLPAVLHGHSDEDVTTVLAVVLLLAVGVERETAVEAIDVRGGSPSPTSAAIDAIDATYGGIEAYLRGPAGLAIADLAALRDQLVAPATWRGAD